MNVFHVQGLVVDNVGRPVRDVHVTIYDRDPTQDDLLGLVRTNEHGVFSLRFLEEEFQQHFLEHEATPDLSVIVWMYEGDDATSVLLERDLEVVAQPGQVTDLGVFELACPRDALTGDPDAAHVRGTRSRGLGLDDRLFGYALEQVLPIVERHTGWTDLREHIDVAFVEDFVQINKVYQAYLAGRLEEINASPGWIEALADQLRGALENRLFGGLYEPLSRTIFLNQNIGAFLTLESFMVLLGHELVHLGQFIHHPELLTLLAEQSQWEEEWFVLLDRSQVGADLVELSATSSVHVLMTDLEGHAQHIEQDFLSAAFGGTLPETTSLGARTMRWLMNMAAEDALRLKRRQYVLGRQHVLYERDRLGTTEVPIPFAKASVFLRELDLLPKIRRVWEHVVQGEFAQAIKLQGRVLKEHIVCLGAEHPRHDDLRYVYSVLLTLDTDDVLDAHTYAKRHIKELSQRLGASHPRTLRERYRAATTMDANGARALGMSFLAEVLEDPDALARGLEDASDWLEPDFPLHFKNLTAEFTLSLRKPLEPAQEAFLYGPEEVNGDEV